MKVLVIVTDNTEESELIGTISLLDRAGIKCIKASASSKEFIGSHKNVIVSDMLIKDVDTSEFEAIYLPGGSGSNNLRDDERILKIVKDFKDKYMFAICAAPSILGKLGYLDGKEFACYPGFERFMPKGIKSNSGVAVSGNIITAKSVHFVTPFALEIIKMLKGNETKEKVMKEICWEE